MKTEREHQLDQALQDILRILATRYAPEKVILFGSVARGNVSEWSDLDLLVIKDTPQPFLQRLKEVALLCQATVGVDYLVYTPAELERMIADGNPFVLGEILAHGKVLYERQPFTAMA